MKNSKLIFYYFFVFISITAFAQKSVHITKDQLKDKIMGGWAGQTIGVTYGASVEFRFTGSMINDYQKIKWYNGLLKKVMIENPGVYDDLYMDLTFVDVFEKEGLTAPAESFAKAIANAGYMLWHANQSARYNLLNGIMPPESGNWLNNPHADCIDYQIESDFAGLMSPGMSNTASEISDKIGHIMNYGDGWYGGIYVGAMYSLAFTSNNINFIVTEALKTIPTNTRYYKCISDVIKWHKKYPNDWKETWFRVQKKWTDDFGCPEGVFSSFNIDATVNSAYVVMGLLYGNGDFSKTIEIATRCGQDADCNPSTAGGILGTMLGYNSIPEYWKLGLKDIEDIDFKYTNISLNKAYDMSFRQALLNVETNGGKIVGNDILIKIQKPKPVLWEQSFQNLYPVEKLPIEKELCDYFEFDFEASGFVLRGDYKMKSGNLSENKNDSLAVIEVYIDDKFTEKINLPLDFTTRRNEICWNYLLDQKKHKLGLKLINPNESSSCFLYDVLLYCNEMKN